MDPIKTVKITYCEPGDSTHGGGFSAAVKRMKREAKRKRPGKGAHSFHVTESAATAAALDREFRAIVTPAK